MAAGKIAIQKASGGVTTITGVDGTGATELQIPESGVLATLESPAFTGTPTAPTPTAGDNTTKVATTAFATTALNLKADLSGATFTGQVKGITPVSAADLTRKDYVDSKAPLASPAFTGTPTAPTATAGTNTTQVATTAFVLANASAATIASTAEAQAGTNNTKVITPLRLREGLNAGGTAPIYACRAWVNFNGTDTVAISASGNVSSITDNGVGDYTVNFTTAMPDSGYSMGQAAQKAGNLDSTHNICYAGSGKLHTSCRVEGHNQLGTIQDSVNMSCIFFR
jgi:hypothetical protein